MRYTLLTNASRIIVFHNHPNGNTSPSPSDLVITKKIMRACESIEVDLVEHFIICEGEFLELKKSGWLNADIPLSLFYNQEHKDSFIDFIESIEKRMI